MMMIYTVSIWHFDASIRCRCGGFFSIIFGLNALVDGHFFILYYYMINHKRCELRADVKRQKSMPTIEEITIANDDERLRIIKNQKFE
jgi:hypothetical protein